ncbi:hypothetical protein [Eisenbergiella sp.]
MTSFVENKELVAMTIILLLLSILCKFITGIFLNTLIREAENMSSTENRVLKQCKIKFRNCYKLNDGVPNIPVFVDKFLNRIQIWKFSMDGLSHFAGQLMMLSVFFAGAGACKGIIDGKTLGEILPFYLMSFLGLYLYFSVSGLVDVNGKKAALKTSLTDYLENHMAARLSLLDESERLAGGEVLSVSAGGVILREMESIGEEPDVKPDGKPEEKPDGKQSELKQTALKQLVLKQIANKQTSMKQVAAKQTSSKQSLSKQMTGKQTSGKQMTAELREKIRPERVEAMEKSPAETQMEEQIFTKNQEKELEELLKEFFA